MDYPEAILGALAGDIAGSIYERNNIKTEEFPLYQPESRFTDDSVMTLAVAKALMSSESQMPSSTEIVAAMQELGRAYPNAGYGRHFRVWLQTDNAQPYEGMGNGSAMRVSAVGWYADDLATVERVAQATAEVSHSHEEGIRGAMAVAGCILLVRQGATNDEVRTYVEDRIGYNLDFTLDEIRPTYAFDATCPGSVPQAITAFLESSSFEGTIRKAISLGGDSDTIAAIAASIAQGRYAIPAWIAHEVHNVLSQAPDLHAINNEFCARYALGEHNSRLEQNQ